jgi:hypothetical protein
MAGRPCPKARIGSYERLAPKPGTAQVKARPWLSVVVRGCLVGTVQDCCEWHASPMARGSTWYNLVLGLQP